MALFSACHCSSSAVPKSFFSTSSSQVATSYSSASLPLYSPFLCNSLSAIVQSQRPTTSIRPYSLHKISCRIDDSSANWGNRPPKETILLPGCDYEHWLIVMEFPTDPKPSREEMIDTYVKTLATVLGSEEEAKKKIYALSTTTYTGFQANISEETSNKLKGLPGVLWVLPDSYLDVPNKDYGGDKYIDGKVIPRPPPRQSERQQRGYNDRPRNYERRYERRRNGPQVERRNPMQAQRRDPQIGQRDTVQEEGQ